MPKSTSVYDFISSHLEKDAVSFHMPGHKGSKFYRRFGYNDFLNRMMDYDITEIAGADNLFQAESCIKGIQDRYAKLYDVKKSYILINGSSGGNIAAILASVNKGRKLILARNCHKSVFNALSLGDIKPVYAYPSLIEEYNISGVISPEEIRRLIIANPEADAVFITSPNYYGICSDVKSIAKIVHSYGKALIVDEAHGAHLHFSKELPMSAVKSGADIVINSTHKTLGSFTQSAALHYNTDLVDQYLLEDKLQCLQSTSPSYILMTSMDITAKILEAHRDELMSEWEDNLKEFYLELKKIPGLKTMGMLDGLDWTKINFSMEDLHITGAELDRILMDQYSIYTELFTGYVVMAMSGIGNTKNDYQRLLNALLDISSTHGESSEEKSRNLYAPNADRLTPPKQAVMFEIPNIKKTIPLMESQGLICGSSIIPYPPGIPLICPGERIDADAITYIKALRDMGEKVIGVNENEEIIVGK